MNIAVVTGGSRGIGLAIARRFAVEDYSVVIADLDPGVEKVAAELAESVSAQVVGVEADVSSPVGRLAVSEAVGALGGELRALVNNAGITRDAMLHKMDTEQFAAVIRVNLGAAYELALALEPLFADRGALVNLSSKSGWGNPGQLNYAVSKSGLIGMTRSLALRWAPRVRVNAIAPAFIDTEMTAAIPGQIRTEIIERIPAGRPGVSGEVAELAYFLGSEHSSYITGQLLPICGGRTLA